MSHTVDPREVEKAKNIMKEKIIADTGVPDDTKFRQLLNFDINKKIKISDRQALVAERLTKGYYHGKPKELQEDLNSIDRKLPWADFFNVNFSGLDLSRVEFSIGGFEGSNFRNCNLSHSNFVFTSLDRADFSGARMDGANFSMARAHGTKFTGASMPNIDLSMSDVTGADFSHSQLPMANISASFIRNCNFMGSNLSGADLSNSELENSDFSSANLTGVSVEGSSISGTIFETMRQTLERREVKYGDGEVNVNFKESEDTSFYGGVKSPYGSSMSSYMKKSKYRGDF